MVDGGADLETEKAQQLAALAATPPSDWWGAQSGWLREGMKAAMEGIPQKLAYGSDFPYRAMPGAPSIEGEDVNTKFSMGKGGLSVVWGAATMSFAQHDLHGWPVSAAELAPHYKALLEFMPVAQESDDLEELWPTFQPTQAMPLSPQARALWARMEANKPALRKKGVRFGKSRLAVEAPRCVRCGLCMYGCPYQLIYSTGFTVDALLQHPNFTYSPGYAAQRMEESTDEVRVHAMRGDRTMALLRAERVFVAAGVLASAALMLRTLGIYDRAVTFRESHYYLLPMLRLAGVPGFELGGVHTLTQIFLEIMDDAISPNTIHLQTYTYNDLFEQPIARKLGPLAKIFPWKTFLSRLYLLQGYLHSDHSPLTTGTLVRRGEGDVLRLVAEERPETTPMIDRLVKKLAGMRSETGMLPLKPLMARGEPGRGFHTGSSFPMQAQPESFGSDMLRRTGGLQRLHLVDSSVLPSIPATTITYTVMANAHRIGTAAGRGEM